MVSSSWLRGERVGAGLVVAPRQKIAAVVHDGDAIGGKRRHGRGDQMLDGPHLSAVHAPRRLQHHRGGRLLVVAGKDLALGNDQMHAGGLDALDGLHRAGEFPFQGALMVDVLDKGGGAEGVRLVENLIADAGGGQIVLGQRHAQLGHLVGGNQDGAAVLDVIFDGHAVQLGGDGGGVARFKPGEQDGLGRFGDRAGDIKEECGEHGGNAGHHAEPRRANRFEKFRQDSSPRERGEKPRPFC